MKKLQFFFLLLFASSFLVHAGEGLPTTGKNRLTSPLGLKANGPQASRFNIKLQPALFWATLGLEFEYVISPKMTVGVNVLGKIGNADGKRIDYSFKQEEFLDNGFLAEVMGRYYISLNKRKLTLAPTGFYVQASAGYSKLLYFDGSTRPFTLHTRTQKTTDPNSQSDFVHPSPIVGGLGAGYQIELLTNKIIANVLLGAQTNSDTQGVFFSVYASPSIGIMF